MNGGFAKITVLVLVILVSALAQSGPFARQASLQQPGKIHAAVLTALEQEPQVGVIVSLQPPVTPLDQLTLPDLQQDVAARQANVLGSLSSSDFELTWQYESVPALVGRVTPSGIQTLAGLPDVWAVHLNSDVFPTLLESVPLMKADQVHTGGVTGADVDVAVLDSGIDPDHPDLADSLASEHCTLFTPEGDPSPAGCPGLPSHPARDGFGHGTLVSGAITSNGDNGLASAGVAPGARISRLQDL
ncbi:MAG: S8 family serine peptidase [Dehalococcoidia bacterium]